MACAVIGCGNSYCSRPEGVSFHKSHVQFRMDSGPEIQQESHLRITSKNLYTGNRVPVPYGMLDKRMGISSKESTCSTCNQGLNECVGHFGYLDLALPVFHVGHFRSSISILQMICKTCSNVMIKSDDKSRFRRRLLNPHLSYLAKKIIHSQILLKAKKNYICPHCTAVNGTVKKGPGLMKILHEPFRGKKKTDTTIANALKQLHERTENNRELNQMLGLPALIDELNPLIVLELFKNIPKWDVPLLGMTSLAADPVNLMVTRLFVPPVCIRPSVLSDVKAGTCLHN